MKKDLKISLPLYKIGYSLAFIVTLSCVHSVVYINEIGPAIDEKMAVLAMVFCADTYLIEKQCRRREVFRLYSIKNQYHAILRRIMAQIGYLTAISILTYGMFYWQRPVILDEKRSEIFLFLLYCTVVFITIFFWSVLSVTVCNLLQSIWGGMGMLFLVWLFFVSKAGGELLGVWNPFSYEFCELTDLTEWKWAAGKILTAVCAVILLLLQKKILEKRG